MSDALKVAIIATIGTVIVAGLGVLGAMIQRTHRLVNSRFTEMMELMRAKGHAEGVKAEIARRDAEDLVQLRSKANERIAGS